MVMVAVGSFYLYNLNDSTFKADVTSMKAEIISTGTEILLGEITDTNTSFLAGQLATLCIDLYYASSVGDNFERLSGDMKLAWQRSDLILMTGGRGATPGDTTRG